MPWMAAFCHSKRAKRFTRLLKQRQKFCGLPSVRAVHPPRAKRIVAPRERFGDLRRIIGAFGATCALKPGRIGFAQAKQVAATKATVPQHFGAALAARDRRIVRHLSGFGRVQHDEKQSGAGAVPGARQSIAILFAR